MPIGIRSPADYEVGQPLISILALATMLRVNQKTGMSYVVHGLIPAIEAGGRYFVREIDALAFRDQFPTPLPRIGRMLVELKSEAR